ncbi:MAG: 50S ribosomal protein L4 [Candidatus Woesearchaeota archaeon]
MKIPLIDLSNKELKKIDLPNQFNEMVREDLIKKAVLAINANKRQPYGAKPDAGKRASAELSRRRKKYRGSYGQGISRVPRKILSRRGTQMNWVGAFAPGTVKGRRAHPPKSIKIWTKKINLKERRLAIRSALSACIQKKLVENRGHIVPENYPFVIENKFEKLNKTKEVLETLKNVGLTSELSRIAVKKIRAGKGKMRGRKYKVKKGPLLVVSKDCPLIKSARNIMGVEVILVNKLNAKALAPNTTIGRLCVFTEDSIKKLSEDNLFTNIKMKKSQKAGALNE